MIAYRGFGRRGASGPRRRPHHAAPAPARRAPWTGFGHPARREINAGTTATASISTSILGSIRPETSTIVITGRIAPNTSPCARPTSSARAMSVT